MAVLVFVGIPLMFIILALCGPKKVHEIERRQ